MVVLSDLHLILSTNNVVTTPFITLTFEGVVYGLYTVLFAICIYIVETSPHPVSHLKLYTPALVPLYVLATIGFALSVANAVQTSALYIDIIHGDTMMSLLDDRGRKSIVLSGLTHSMFLLSNVIVDGVLIYRTYFIWGSRKRVVIAPTVVSIASNGLGIAAISIQLSASFTSFKEGNWIMVAFLGTVAFTQLLFTFMIAGRIWWISRHIGPYGSSAMRKNVKTIVAIMLESGILYTILLVVYQIQNAVTPIAVDLGLYPILIQFAGMSPTLIIVRAALGVSVEWSPDANARIQSFAITVDWNAVVPASSPVIPVDRPTSGSRSPLRDTERTLSTKLPYNLDIERVAPFVAVRK